MINFKKFWEGLRLIPKSTSTADSKGEMDVTSADGKLNYHNGTSTSPMVTEAHSATLTNKTIDGDNNTITDVALTSLKAAPGDANEFLQRDGSGIVITSKAVPTGAVVGTSDTQTLTGKTIDGDDNTLSDIALSSLKTVGGESNTFLQRDGSGDVVSGTKAVPTGDVVGTSDTQDLSSKRITGGLKFQDGSLTGDLVVVSEGSINGTKTLTLDVNDGSRTLSLSGDLIVNGNATIEAGIVVNGPVTSTDNSVALFDGTNGNLLQDSTVTISGTGEVAGVTEIQVDNLNVDGNTISSTNSNGSIKLEPNGSGIIDLDAFSTTIRELLTLTPTTDASTTGTDVDLYIDTAVTILTNAGLVSVAGIESFAGSTIQIIINRTGNDVTFKNNAVTSEQPIITGNGQDLVLSDDAAIFAINDANGNWQIIGGTGGSLGNLEVIGNTISNTNLDGDINLTLVGNGQVTLGSSNIAILASGSMAIAGNLLVDNIDINGNTISSTDTNGNINLTPNGTGSVLVDSLTVNGTTISGSDVELSATDDILITALDDLFLTGDGVSVRQQGSTPATPTSLYAKIYPKNGKFYQLNSGSSETLVGQAANTINYIVNYDAEVGTTSWATYANAAGLAPVDGTGGSPSITLTRSTSTPLRGVGSFLITKDAANRQGQGTSYDFTIDTVDQSKVLSLSFDYAVASGTFDYGSFTAADPSDVVVYIYDVTNATVIQPPSFMLDGSGKFTSSFQAAPNSTSYRLILHIAGTNAAAWTFKFDNVLVGPQEATFGGQVVAANYGVATQAVGSASETTIIWNTLVADSSASMNTSTGQYTIPVSGWYAIDSIVKTASLSEESATARIKLNGSTTIASHVTSSIAGTSPAMPISTIYKFNAGDLVTVTVQSTADTSYSVSNTSYFAIAQIQSPTQSGSGNVVAMSTLSNSSQVPTASAFDGTANIVWTTANFTTVDTNAAFNGTTYTVPVSGWYTIDSAVRIAGTEAANDSLSLVLYRNASIMSTGFTRITAASLASSQVVYTGTLYFNAGDALTMRVDTSITGPSFAASGNAGAHYWTIAKIQAPANTASNQLVAAYYNSNAAQVIADNTDVRINFEDVVYDTTNSVTVGASWAFTCPISGLYEITSFINFQSEAHAVGDRVILYAGKNGVPVQWMGYWNAQTTTSIQSSALGTSKVQCNAGDTLQIFVNNNGGGTHTLSTSPDRVWVQIQKVG